MVEDSRIGGSRNSGVSRLWGRWNAKDDELLRAVGPSGVGVVIGVGVGEGGRGTLGKGAQGLQENY